MTHLSLVVFGYASVASIRGLAEYLEELSRFSGILPILNPGVVNTSSAALFHWCCLLAFARC